jgi:hypothetical protein
MQSSEPDVVTEPRDAGHPADGGPVAIDRPWSSLFEDRYGAGSHQRLMALLGQPCVTFADIASRFEVTRERVRQWHARLMPDAPRGHQRQQQCRVYRQKRRLLEDPLFRSFYQHARPHLSPGRIQLLPAHDGFRTRAVRLDDRAVAITRARLSPGADGTAAYRLHRYRGPADFIYYHLAAADYLFLPTSVLPAEGALFLDEPASAYRPFKNTFGAFTGQS